MLPIVSVFILGEPKCRTLRIYLMSMFDVSHSSEKKCGSNRGVS